MKRVIIIGILFCIVWTGDILAQKAADALLLSQYYSGSTARSAGMGGAFGALGGDLSVLSYNPAGLAVYRGSEFTITPALAFSNTRAEYDNRAYNEKTMHFMLNNIGYVYTKNLYNEKGFQSINFGIAYNRLSDFNSNAFVKRQQATSSLLDEFVFYANGFDDGGGPWAPSQLYDFYEGLAYDTKAIFYDSDNNVYLSDYNDFGYGQPLYRKMSTRGNIGEFDFSFGANINHKLFLGATLGLQDIYYKEYYFHEETPGFDYMDSFNFSDEFTLNGFGVNFKVGLIYRPIQMLRLGAAIHTPTHFWLKPYHLTGMETFWNTSPPGETDKHWFFEFESDPSERYRLTTPWRYNLSAATVFGRIGMLNVDVEIVDYSSSSVMPKSKNKIYDSEIIEFYDDITDEISNILKTSVNVKTGAEFRLGPVYLRGGVGYYGNPYNKDKYDADIKNTLKATVTYSGGIGFRARDFYMDAAYTFTKHPERINNLYLSYDATTEWYEQAKLQTNNSKFILTFGFRF